MHNKRKRFLLICNDVIGKQMAGPAIRYVEMAGALSHYHDVTLVAPRVDEISFTGFESLKASKEIMMSLAHRADVVIVQGDALSTYPFLKKIKGALIADLYCPIPLEYHQSSIGVPADIRMRTSVRLATLLSEQLCYADHFLCASEKQRDFWLGGLAMAGRINGLRWPDANHADINGLISVVPFGIPSLPPIKNGTGLREHFGISRDDFVAIWGGGVYQWFDPLTIIRAINELASEGHRVHLVFMGVKHPNTAIHQHDMCRDAVRLSDELGLTGRFVHFNYGWIDYDHRQNYFLDADVGVSAHFDTPETRFSFRTRMLDYLWCGIPIVATKGDFFGGCIRENQLGISIGYEDIEGWKEALIKCKDDSEYYRQCKRNIAEFSKNYTWSSIMKPLVDNVGSMTPSADRDAIRQLACISFKSPGVLERIRNAYYSGGISLLYKLVSRRLFRLMS